jgi:hypothetical protein
MLGVKNSLLLVCLPNLRPPQQLELPNEQPHRQKQPPGVTLRLPRSQAKSIQRPPLRLLLPPPQQPSRWKLQGLCLCLLLLLLLLLRRMMMMVVVGPR